MALLGDMTVPSESTAPSPRAFVHSLNVLLKLSRLYGLQHARAAAQFEATWSELEKAVRAARESRLLLGASGSQLLMDGVPIESTPAERSFAELLTSTGVSSICFYPNVEREEFAQLVRAFMEAGSKARLLNERLELRFGKSGASGICVNEIRFVAEDAAVADVRLAAQLAAKTLGADIDVVQDWFRSPEKMIQLIVAAEGAHGGPSGPGAGAATGSSPAVPALDEGDLQNLLRWLAQLGEAVHGKTAGPLEEVDWQHKAASLSADAQKTLRQALATLAVQTPAEKVDEATLLRLAEDLAIRFALDRFQRGEVRVNAVRQLLDKMNHELATLRKLLKAREEKMAGAGLTLESHADVLDRQFWAGVPESGKRAVLMSPEAWCIPPRNVQQYVEALLERGDAHSAEVVLLQYATCVRNKDAEARKKAAIGLAQLAEVYGKAASRRLQDVLARIAQQMAVEKDAELQTLQSAAFVRLSQEAAQRRFYRAMQQALDSLSDLEELRPTWARSLRPRIGVENRLPEFIEEVLTAEAMPEGFAGVLIRLPQTAGEHLAVRLARAGRRTERENIVQLAKAAGNACTRHLREVLKSEQPAKAASVVGLLSRLDPTVVDDVLPQRLRQGGRNFQDAVVRQIAIAGAPERGRLLANSLELLDTMVLPLALDEIGMCGDANTAPKLLRLADGEILPEGPDYLRVKAIEALGRMRASAAIGHLRRFVEMRKAFSWAYPEEMRTAATQALRKLDPEWVHAFVPQSGLDAKALVLAPLDPVPERDVVRHRRYRRIRLPRNVPAVITSPHGRYSSAISVLSLDGGLLTGNIQLTVGTEATLKIPAGLRSINMQTVVRFVRSHQAGFEMVGMGLSDRAKLRRLLVSLGGPDAGHAPGT